MRKYLTTFQICLLCSLFIHFSFFSGSYIDWNLREQYIGLKESMSQVQQNVGRAEGVGSKAGVVGQKIASTIQEILETIKKGDKLRFSPDHEVWKQLDQEKAEELAKQGKGSGNDDFSKFLAPPKPIEVSIVSAPKEESLGMEIYLQKDTEQCRDDSYSFGGIGLRFENLPDSRLRVVEVPEGYPAHRAGIQIGDIISLNPMEIRGEIGSVIDLDVVRAGRKITFTMTRTKVCYKKENLQPQPKVRDFESIINQK